MRPASGGAIVEPAGVEHETREIRRDVVGAGGGSRQEERVLRRMKMTGEAQARTTGSPCRRLGSTTLYRQGPADVRKATSPHVDDSPEHLEPVLVGRPLTLEALAQVARRGRAVAFDPEARVRVVRSRSAIDAIASAGDDGPRVYGVNTGFGALSETRISASDVRQLQKNLVRSHSTGVGPDLRSPRCAG